MRCAILADIHSNLEAFTAVLDDIEDRGGADEVWCLGDVVGYGPEPRECIARLRETEHVCVVGNHDGAAIGKLDVSVFNPHAAIASRWTAQQLEAEDRQYLGDLRPVIEKADFTLVHGSPREPLWEYLLSTWSAEQSLAHFSTRFCLVGHTHAPAVFTFDDDGRCSARQFLPDNPLVLGERRLLINPGAVGQPRDGDPRASYAIYDSEAATVHLYRVPYDIPATQAKMMDRGLPMPLAARLSHGL